MFITQLLENPQEPSIVVVYAGRFQPFHKGHHAVFNWLTGKYGRNNVFIATSNKTDALKSPFTFTEKSYFMNLTGIPADRIVESAQPYRAEEIVKNYNPQTTLLMFAVSEKDMAEDPRFKVGAKKDGSPSYFQHLPANLRDAKTLNEHAYLVVTPKFDFTVLGQPADSASQIRAMYTQADDATRKQIIADLFGKYTPEAQQIMDNKLGATQQEAIAMPKVAKMYEDELGGIELKTANLIRRAKAMHPLAKTDDQALAMYVLDKEQKDVDSLDREEHDIEAEIAKIKADIAELKAKQVNEDAAGVGVVKNSKDPRYVMATTGDQNDVNSKTLGNMMKAYNLVGKKSPKTGQQQVKSTIAESVSSVENAIIRRIMNSRTDLLMQYGPKDIMDATREVAEFVGDVDEIGSSDVSGWVRHVEQMLGNMQDEPKDNSLEGRLREQLNQMSEGAGDITAMFSGYSNYMDGRAANVFKHYGITVLDRQHAEDEDISEYTVTGSKEALNKARAYLERSEQFGGMILKQGAAEGSGNGYYYLQGGIEQSNKFASAEEAEKQVVAFGNEARVPKVALRFKAPGAPAQTVKTFSINNEQGMAEARDGDVNFGSTVTRGSWVVYNDNKVKRFKTHSGAKAYAEKNGGKVASSEFYADKIQGKQGVAEGQTKELMWRDAERMELNDFLDKWGHEDWVAEFWNNISGELDEGWKDWVAGGALAAGLAFGGGAAHAQDAAPVQQAAPAMTQQANGGGALQYTQGISFPAAYTINFQGNDYKFAGRDEAAPAGGQVVTVPGGAVGIRGLKPVQVTLAKDGKYYVGAATNENTGTLNKLDPKGDYYAKRKALQDIQLDPSTGKDPELTRELMRRKAELEKEARAAGLAEVSDFKRQELQHELGDERNNIAININGKTWKVIPGKGYADSQEERNYLNGMKRWAEKKSAATGKKWTVHLTGANPTAE